MEVNMLEYRIWIGDVFWPGLLNPVLKVQGSDSKTYLKSRCSLYVYVIF